MAGIGSIHCRSNLSIDQADDVFHLTPSDKAVRNWQEIPACPAKKQEHENLSKSMVVNKYTPGILFKEPKGSAGEAVFARDCKSQWHHVSSQCQGSRDLGFGPREGGREKEAQ